MEKVIEEFPDDNSPVEMEEGVNNEDNDKKEITSENEYQGVIHRDIIEYEKETIWDTMDKVIEECPNATSPVDMEECVNDKVYDENEKMMRENRKKKQQIWKHHN